MNEYRYTVKLEVVVEAFDDGDAFDMIQESFGVGETGAVSVVECEYQEKRSKKK